MDILIQILIGVVLWLVTNYISFVMIKTLDISNSYINHPWLDVKPLNCIKCFNFWLTSISASIIYISTSFQYHYGFGLTIFLSILTVVGRIIAEKKGETKL